MDTRMGKTGVPRLVVVALAALSLLMAAALATPMRADAHETAGSTAIYVDGDLVERTSDDHFAYSKILKPGCHNAKVVSRQDGSRVVQRKHICVNEKAKLTVTVNHGNVSSTVTTNY